MTKKRVKTYFKYVKVALTEEQYINVLKHSDIKNETISFYLNDAVVDKLKKEDHE